MTKVVGFFLGSEWFGHFWIPFSRCPFKSVIASLHGNLPKPGFPLPSGLYRKFSASLEVNFSKCNHLIFKLRTFADYLKL